MRNTPPVADQPFPSSTVLLYIIPMVVHLLRQGRERVTDLNIVVSSVDEVGSSAVSSVDIVGSSDTCYDRGLHVLQFLAKTFSEWRGSLNPTRRGNICNYLQCECFVYLGHRVCYFPP